MSAEIDWSAVAHEFEWDGSLRDVYVHDTSVAEWQVVLDAIRTRYPPLTFLAGGVPSELPEIAAEVFPLWARGAPPVLGFSVGGVQVACHFFTPDEIEFDLDTREVTGPDQLRAILTFLGTLSTLTGKPAVLTPENVSDEPIFRADPISGDAQYVPPPSRPAG